MTTIGSTDSGTPQSRRKRAKESPLKRQYERIKAEIPDGILLFRLGDFYETFAEDAEVVARDLGIALTSKDLGGGHRVPLAGVPTHSLNSSIARLLEKGHRVAICEQFGDPKTSKGILDRQIVRLVTPGTVLQHDLLPGNANNFLAAAIVRDNRAGLAYADITTSEFVTLELAAEDLSAEIESLGPAELLTPEDAADYFDAERLTVVPMNSTAFDPDSARERLLTHFGVATLEGYGCEDMPLATAAAGAVLAYLQDTQRGALTQVQSLSTRSTADAMALDPQTVRTLELFEGTASGTREGSLLGLWDFTQTAMGGRLLRQWLGRPLLREDEISARHDDVEALAKATILRSRVRAALHDVPDLERLVNFVRSGSAAPRDLVALRRGLYSIVSLHEALGESPSTEQGTATGPAAWARETIGTHEGLRELLQQAIADDPGATLATGGVVRQGFSPELEDLRDTSSNARVAVAALEAEERQATGIPTLKVGYSRVFGYYIEVTRPHLARVPEEYIRKQTVANGERFFTGRLKELEVQISEAQLRAEELEQAVFRRVCSHVVDEGEAILATARSVSRLDALTAFAEAAVRLRLTRPVIDDSRVLEASAARHPVVEANLNEPFVPNDIRLTEDQPIAIITGPNMAGKSTYLRQIALVALLAQIGSFVPAASARVGLVDRIFTRAGLHDDISTGRSTFMVEMIETAAILNQATSRSLIILDETGRGTSTYDGLSIAWAVVEHIHNHPRLGARTAFATHYHELVELGDTMPKAFNLHALVSEEDGRIVFLREIAPGGADRSYGVHVAQLAGLPRDVVGRAREVLAQLEDASNAPGKRSKNISSAQPSLFAMQTEEERPAREPSEIERELSRIDPEQMTPLEALAKLYDLRRLADRDEDVREDAGLDG